MSAKSVQSTNVVNAPEKAFLELLVLDPAGWRHAIFQKELPLVLEAFRHGDSVLFDAHPEPDEAPIGVHFRSSLRRYRRRERWGTPADYRLNATE